jgi:hypothetical protein
VKNLLFILLCTGLASGAQARVTQEDAEMLIKAAQASAVLR